MQAVDMLSRRKEFLMLRLFKIAFFVAAIAMFAVPADVRAGGITLSKNNPYKSFNISGINYGSMQWEREHGSAKNNSYAPRHGFRFRR